MAQRAFSGAQSEASACFHMGFSHPLEPPGYIVRDSAALDLFRLFLHRFFQQSVLDTVPSSHAVRYRWPERLLSSPGEGRGYDQVECERSALYRVEASEKLKPLCVNTGSTLVLPLRYSESG